MDRSGRTSWDNLNRRVRVVSNFHAYYVHQIIYVHQVTASLYILQQRAYKKHLESVESASSFPNWCKDQAKNIQFQVDNMTLKFEVLILILMHSFGQSDFKLYIFVLMATIPWMFALDHTNAQRLPVHIRDMAEPSNKHPHVNKEFTSGGKFTVQKTSNAFFIYTTRPGS